MKTSYVLIDFENVHVKSLALLKGDHFRVKVFLGPKNAKLPVELVLAMHELGKSADYIQLGVSGANALDFHITYYLGKLTAQDPEADFHIISKDTGFDSLIKHLLNKGIHCKRAPSIEQMLGAAPAARSVNEPTTAVPKTTEPKSVQPRSLQPKNVQPKSVQPKRAEPGKGQPRKGEQPKAAHLTAVATSETAMPIPPTVQTVIENLQSRGAARPRTIKTLCSSIKTLRLNLSDEQITDMVAELQILGKITINGSQVTYTL